MGAGDDSTIRRRATKLQPERGKRSSGASLKLRG
jgi:hypothetical protein